MLCLKKYQDLKQKLNSLINSFEIKFGVAQQEAICPVGPLVNVLYEYEKLLNTKSIYMHFVSQSKYSIIESKIRELDLNAKLLLLKIDLELELFELKIKMSDFKSSELDLISKAMEEYVGPDSELLQSCLNLSNYRDPLLIEYEITYYSLKGVSSRLAFLFLYFFKKSLKTPLAKIH